MKFLILGILAFCITACNTGEKKSSTDSTVSQSVKKSSNVNLNQEIVQSYGVEDTIKTRSIEDSEGIKDGPVLINYPNGVMKAKGKMLKGKKIGLWESFYPSGTKQSSTYFVDGKQEGYSITYHKNGAIKYRGQFKNGESSGHWEFYNASGDLVSEKDF